MDELRAPPSVIDEQDVGRIARLRRARSIYKTFVKYNSTPDEITPEEDEIIATVIALDKNA